MVSGLALDTCVLLRVWAVGLSARDIAANFLGGMIIFGLMFEKEEKDCYHCICISYLNFKPIPELINRLNTQQNVNIANN